MENQKSFAIFHKKSLRTKINSGSYELFDSGIVLAYSDELPIEITEEFNQAFIITIRFVLKTDETKKYRIDLKVDEGKNIIEYTCFNFDNTLGTGTNVPIEICTLNNKKAYIHFWFYSLGGDEGKIKKLEYSIWTEK